MVKTPTNKLDESFGVDDGAGRLSVIKRGTVGIQWDTRRGMV